jgi:hypothetical protein
MKFSDILISKKQFLCNKKPYCTLVPRNFIHWFCTRVQYDFLLHRNCFLLINMLENGMSRLLLLVNKQLLHLNEINMRFYGAEYNNIERGEAIRLVQYCSILFNIVVLGSIKLPQKFRASLCSVQFFQVRPPLLEILDPPLYRTKYKKTTLHSYTIQLLHLNEINTRFYGAEYNNIERGESA